MSLTVISLCSKSSHSTAYPDSKSAVVSKTAVSSKSAASRETPIAVRFQREGS
jgi:hypothetical protein